jgi:hypothetical protein
MDLLTTRKLWKASEYYVRQHNKNLKRGTDEYYKAVADIYNRVIEETQPNYTTMQRPQLLRSDSTVTQTLMMFKTQPFQNFNILYDAVGNYVAKASQYQADKTAENKAVAQEAYKDMQNAVLSQLLQLAVFASMTCAWAFTRGKDDKWRDEDGNLTILSFVKRLGYEMMSGASAMIPFGADIYNLVASNITGEYYYGFSSVTDSSINDLFNSFTDLMSAISKGIDYATTDDKDSIDATALYKQLKKTAEECGRYAGIPVQNLMNLVDSIYRWAMIASNGKYVGEYEAQKERLASDSVKKSLLYKAYQNDKKQYAELRQRMIEDGYDQEQLDKDLEKWRMNNMSDKEKERFQSSMLEIISKPEWIRATEDERDKYTKTVKKYVLGKGVSDSDTAKVIEKMREDGTSFEQAIIDTLREKQEGAVLDAKLEESLSQLYTHEEWQNASEEERKYYKSILNEIVNGKDTARANAIREQAVDGKTVEDVMLEGMRKAEESINTVSSSDIWEGATDDQRQDRETILRKIALGIEDSQTTPVLNKAVDGVTPEEVVLYQLALKKVDQPNKNGNLGTYDKTDKEEALKLLLKEYDLTDEQREAFIKGNW